MDYSLSRYSCPTTDELCEKHCRTGSMASDQSRFDVTWSGVNLRVLEPANFRRVWNDISTSVRVCVDSMFQMRKKENCHMQPGRVDKEAVTILRNVHGSFRSGELTALMGPSGAGKTSLLNLIAGRKKKGYSGQLCVKGADTRLKIRAIPQDDYLPPYLTVRESLLVASKCKNSSKGFDHKQAVTKVVRMLGLERCVDTATRKISGGQKKRVSIASELLSELDILILDEPTSGLDSVSCFSILTELKKIVKTPEGNQIAIVLTIHQPECQVFDLFDKVCVLASGGVSIYDGSPKECINYIKNHTDLSMLRADYNPGSFLIEIASGAYGQPPIDALCRQVRIDRCDRQNVVSTDHEMNMDRDLSAANVFSTNNCKNQRKLDDDKLSSSDLYVDKRLGVASSMQSSHFWNETKTLAFRYSRSMLRDPLQLLFYLLAHLFFPFACYVAIASKSSKLHGCPRLIGQITLEEMATNDELMNEKLYQDIDTIVDNVVLLLITTCSLLLFNSVLAALSFTMDMISSLKEHHNGWYSASSYLTARILVDLPVTIVASSVGVVLFLIATGQAMGGSLTMTERMMIASLASSLVAISGRLVGMICGALLIGQVTTAIFVSLAINLPNALLCGVFVRWRRMNHISKLLAQFSFTKHGFQLNILSRYGFNLCPCEPSDIKETTVSGMPYGLPNFLEYHSNEMSSIEDSVPVTLSRFNQTIDDYDIIQIIAKQIKLFNAYGREIVSCDQVESQVLFELSTGDEDLLPVIAKFIALILSTALISYILVRRVLKLKTSI